MTNRWSDSARAASAAARFGKYGPMMGLQPWGDTARAAAAAARAERAALAGGMSRDEAAEIALDARYGDGYPPESNRFRPERGKHNPPAWPTLGRLCPFSILFKHQTGRDGKRHKRRQGKWRLA